MTTDYQKLFQDADNLRNNGRVSESVKAYASIIELATKDNDQLTTARAWHMAGVSAEMGANGEDQYYHSSLDSYNHAEKIYVFLEKNEELGALCRDVGKLYTKTGNYPKAKDWLERSIEILTATDSYGQLAISYDKLGLCFLRTNDLAQAKENFSKAIELFKKAPEAGFFRATNLYDTAKAYTTLGENEQACNLAEESLSWFMADHPGENYSYRLAELNGLLSILYYRLAENDKAKHAGKNFESLIKNMSPEVSRNITQSLNDLST